MAAYDTFADAANTGALKVVICGQHSTTARDAGGAVTGVAAEPIPA